MLHQKRNVRESSRYTKKSDKEALTRDDFQFQFQEAVKKRAKTQRNMREIQLAIELSKIAELRRKEQMVIE